MLPVTTSQLGTDVKIAWIEPNSGSLTIDGYLIEILTSDLTTYAEAPTCDGQDSYVHQNKFCTVPMETLTSDPFNIQQGDLIKIRVSAQNSLGFSIPSTLNTVGVTAKVQPHKPPTAPQRGVGTSPLQLVVDYAMLTGVFTGNSEITSLQLQWDKGTSGLEWVTLVGDFPYTTSTTYTIN